MTRGRHEQTSVVATVIDVLGREECEHTWRAALRGTDDEPWRYRQHRCGRRGNHIIHECRYCGATR